MVGTSGSWGERVANDTARIPQRNPLTDRILDALARLCLRRNKEILIAALVLAPFASEPIDVGRFPSQRSGEPRWNSRRLAGGYHYRHR
jgi:hypothetical protein